MFDTVNFDKKLNDLVLKGKKKDAEKWLLNAYSELKAAHSLGELGYVVSRLAHFYSMPGTEDVGKAGTYFLEREGLSPGAYAKLQTALFYFYVLESSQKTIGKVDEIEASQVATDRASNYSALTLKGQALLNLERIDGANKVLDDLLDMIKEDPSGLPYGDEINLLQAAILNPILAPGCRGILPLIIPRIRSHEYLQKAKALLRVP